ncbi:MAG: trigger factor [Thermincola sp.]|jgi:trigger factor|nr:trigger factor [Thermincola sp.]MDT3704399.1 trigger factor [Thermincola sp.]
MKVNLEKIEKNVVALQVEVEDAKFNDAMNKAFKKVSQKINIPGFRKGKAPRGLIERHVGKEYLREEALEMVLPETYFEAVRETGIEPIDKPNIDMVDNEDGKPVVFKATVQVKPEVELGEYIGLEVENNFDEPNAEAVNSELEKLQNRHAQLVNLEEGQAELKDTVIIDFEGFTDGVAFPGGAGTDYSLELGSNSFIPGFEDQLVGAKIGDTKEVNVTFPEEYHSPDLAGKDALFKVNVKSIKRKELANLDDEFAKDVSEFETLEELKNDILNRLKVAAEEQAKNKLKDELVDKAVEAAQVEVPEIMVDQKTDFMLQNFSQRLSMQGLNLDDYLKFSGTDIGAVRAEYRPAAEKAVKIDLVLEAISAKENIQATDEDVEAKVAEMAAQYNSEVAVFKQWLQNAGNLEPLKKSITIDKTVDFLQGKAVIK